MTWFDEESAVETSEPREVYTFELPAVTYRLASGDEDVVIDGVTYPAGQISRSSIPIAASGGGTKALDITLPVSHPVSLRWLRGGVPPKFVRVTLTRENNGESEVQWVGEITSGSPDGRLMHFTVPSRLSELMERRLPVAIASRDCSHILYDAQCRVSSGLFLIDTTIADISANVITVNSVGGHPDDWFQFGMLRHVATGEELTIWIHEGFVLTLQHPLFGSSVGDAVQIFAGCDHSINACLNKFNNKNNYSGSPGMPRDNPFLPGNRLGVITQE